MNTNELMIGDWVNRRVGWIDEETKEIAWEAGIPFPIQVAAIYDGLVQYDVEMGYGIIRSIEAADYELSPIPITPEILEKNGFVAGKAKNRKGLRLISAPDLYLSLWRGRLNVRYIRALEKPIIQMQTDCQYVHELQHYLRLMGINKEISL